MTKGNVLPTNMNANSVHLKPAVWNGPEVGTDDLVYPCRAKVQQILNCCEDVSQQLDALQNNLQARRTQMPLEVEGARVENIILHDELCKSKLRIEELEVTEAKLKKKINEMEERVQALTAQLIVYKTDFDLERQDRERAQGRIFELEQKMLAYQRPRDSHCHLHHPAVRPVRNYSFGDLTERGHDVCDDGLAKDDVTGGHGDGSRNEVRPCLSKTERLSSVEFHAQSFDIHDFFPAVSAPSAISVYRADHGEINRDQPINHTDEKVTNKGIVCSAEIQPTHPPSWTRPSWSEAVGSNKLNTRLCERPKTFAPRGTDDAVPCPSKTTPAIGVRSNQSVDRPGFHRTSQPAVRVENDNSFLRCPKCNKCFALLDHLLLLEHLEDC